MSAFIWDTVCWAGMKIKASRDRYLNWPKSPHHLGLNVLWKLCYCFHWKWFWEKNPPCTNLFGSASLLILRKKFPSARLFCPARLMVFKNFPTFMFISSCLSIHYTRVICFEVIKETHFLLDLMKKKPFEAKLSLLKSPC